MEAAAAHVRGCGNENANRKIAACQIYASASINTKRIARVKWQVKMKGRGVFFL